VRSVLEQVEEEGYDGPIVTVWRRVTACDAQPGAELARLAAFDLDPAVSRGAITLLHHALEGPGVRSATRERMKSSAAPVLLRALQEPGLPDDRKYLIGPLYMLCGAQVSLDEFRSFFKDLDGVSERAINEILGTASDEPDGVVEILGYLDALPGGSSSPSEAAIRGVVALGCDGRETNPALAAAILGAAVAMAAERGIAQDAATDALEAMASTRCQRAAWCLAELGRWPAMGTLGTGARTLAEHLASAGVPAKSILSSEPSHGLLTGIDGAGSRSLMLFLRTPQGRSDSLCVLLNDRIGVKEVWCSFGPGDEVEVLLREKDEIIFAPCTLALARELLAHAWAIHEERGEPFPWQLYIARPYFGSEPITPSRRTPDLSAYKLEDKVRSPGLFRGSHQLMYSPVYGGLFFTCEAAYDHLAEAESWRGRLSEEQFEAFAREIAPLEREVLLSRMVANLEVEALAGRADERINRVAARTWLALTENVAPLHEVPYVRALCEVSIHVVTENLRLGFHTQAEADEAALKLDEESGARLDE